VGALVVGLVAFGIYHFANSEQGKKVFGTIGDVAQLAVDSQNAPGAREVAALGCDSAMAMDMDKMQRIMKDRLDAGTSAPGAFSVMVVCQVGVFAKSPPSCEAVASTYLGAAGPPARGFAVSVQRGGSSSNQLCSALYDPEGKKVKDLSPGSTPAMPGK
jgi:hypothetical protein